MKDRGFDDAGPAFGTEVYFCVCAPGIGDRIMQLPFQNMDQSLDAELGGVILAQARRERDFGKNGRLLIRLKSLRERDGARGRLLFLCHAAAAYRVVSRALSTSARNQ